MHPLQEVLFTVGDYAAGGAVGAATAAAVRVVITAIDVSPGMSVAQGGGLTSAYMCIYT